MIFEILLCFSIWLAQLFLGSLLILGFQELVKAQWLGNLELELKQRLKTLFPMTVFFIALFFFREHLYEWTDPARLQSDFTKAYYGAYAFAGRAVFDWIAWLALLFFLRKKIRGMGPIILIVILVTGTQFSNDWVMSLDPHWKSTAFGLIFLLSGILSAFAIAVFRLPLAPPEDQLIDLGSVHFALIATWSYVTLMQFIVIWQGNLPIEAPWYVARLHTSWRYLVLFIVLFQFILPLFLLLMRKFKSSLVFMKGIALSSLFCQSLFSLLLIQPTLHPEGISSPWIFVSFFALVGLTVWILPRKAQYE